MAQVDWSSVAQQANGGDTAAAPQPATSTPAPVAAPPIASGTPNWGAIAHEANGGISSSTDTQNSDTGVLGKVAQAVSGPGTALGTPVSPAFSQEGSGVSDIIHGNIRQGAGKIWDAEKPHVVQGSRLEKVIQAIDPTFQGGITNDQVKQQEQYRATGQPLVNIADQIDKQKHPIARAAAEAAQSMTTPDNVAVMVATGGLGLVDSPQALGVGHRLLSAGFSAGAIGQAYQHLKGFKEAYDKGDTADAEYQLTHAVLSGSMSYLAAADAAGKPLPLATDAERNAINVVAEPIKNAVNAVAEPIKNAVNAAVVKPVADLAKAAGISEKLEDMVRKASPPSKSDAPDYMETVRGALPQLREIIKSNPEVGSPSEMVQAINDHIDNIEGQLQQQAAKYRGQPVSILGDVANRIQSRLNSLWKSSEGKYTSEEIQQANAAVIEQLMQDGTPPDIFQAENIRRRWNQDTNPIFGSNAPSVPAAEMEAKAAANSELRDAIDEKYDHLGVKNIKQWRQQESPLIDVRDQIALAENEAVKRGKWSALKSIANKSGWGLLGALFGGPQSAALAESLGVAKDFFEDRNKNPNTVISRLVKKSNASTEPTGAAKIEIGPEPTVAGLLGPGSIIPPPPADTSGIMPGNGPEIQPLAENRQLAAAPAIQPPTRQLPAADVIPKSTEPYGQPPTPLVTPNTNERPLQIPRATAMPRSQALALESVENKAARYKAILENKTNPPTTREASVIHSELSKLYKEADKAATEFEKAKTASRKPAKSQAAPAAKTATEAGSGALASADVDNLADVLVDKGNDPSFAQKRAQQLVDAVSGKPGYNGIERRVAETLLDKYVGAERRREITSAGQAALSGK